MIEVIYVTIVVTLWFCPRLCTYYCSAITTWMRHYDGMSCRSFHQQVIVSTIWFIVPVRPLCFPLRQQWKVQIVHWFLVAIVTIMTSRSQRSLKVTTPHEAQG